MYVTPTNIIPALVVCYFAWRMARRVRRSIGRQRVRPVGMIFRTIIFCALTIFFAAFSPHETPFMLALGGGLIGGVIVGLVGLRLTKFETTSEGRFYIPNTYIGIAVSLLLVGRIIYRLTLLHDVTGGSLTGPPAFMQSALTVLLFALVAGYYITYYLGIFIHSPKLITAVPTNG